jgi:hypothetical protein
MLHPSFTRLATSSPEAAVMPHATLCALIDGLQTLEARGLGLGWLRPTL